MLNLKQHRKQFLLLCLLIAFVNISYAQYWELSYHFQFWNNDTPHLDISFQAKSNINTKLPMRLIANPWGWGGGDIFQWEIPLTNVVAEYQPNETTAIHYLGNTYPSTAIPPFEWAEGKAYEGYRGRMSLHGSFLDDAVTPSGTQIWIDDVVVKEAGLTLEKFDVEYAPASVAVNETKRFKIGEFVFPTHAPTQLNFWIENRTGKATIDQVGNITGVAPGEVDVYIDTPNASDEKKFTVQITDQELGNKDVNLAVISLSSHLVKAGELIYIKSPLPIEYAVVNMHGEILYANQLNHYIPTANLSSGVYIVLIQTKQDQMLTKKFIVK